VNRILDLGVTLEVDAKVADILSELAGGFDAAFVAVGAHIGRGACGSPGQPVGISKPATIATLLSAAAWRRPTTP
jgi:hypothetical protein